MFEYITAISSSQLSFSSCQYQELKLGFELKNLVKTLYQIVELCWQNIRLGQTWLEDKLKVLTGLFY